MARRRRSARVSPFLPFEPQSGTVPERGSIVVPASGGAAGRHLWWPFFGGVNTALPQHLALRLNHVPNAVESCA